MSDLKKAKDKQEKANHAVGAAKKKQSEANVLIGKLEVEVSSLREQHNAVAAECAPAEATLFKDITAAFLPAERECPAPASLLPAAQKVIDQMQAAVAELRKSRREEAAAAEAAKLQEDKPDASMQAEADGSGGGEQAPAEQAEGINEEQVRADAAALSGFAQSDPKRHAELLSSVAKKIRTSP